MRGFLNIEITGFLAAPPQRGKGKKGEWAKLRLTVQEMPYLKDGEVVDGFTSTYTVWLNGPLVSELEKAHPIVGDWITVQASKVRAKSWLGENGRPRGAFVEFNAEALKFPEREEIAALIAAQREEVAALLTAEEEPKS